MDRSEKTPITAAGPVPADSSTPAGTGPNLEATVKFLDREYQLISKALALLVGVEEPTAEDRAAAAHLKQRLLKAHAADLREKLTVQKHRVEMP